MAEIPFGMSVKLRTPLVYPTPVFLMFSSLKTEHETRPRRQLSQQEMIDRILYIQAVETARCLWEGVLKTAADANLGSIFVRGFAPQHGGTLQFINACGLPEFVGSLEETLDTDQDVALYCHWQCIAMPFVTKRFRAWARRRRR